MDSSQSSAAGFASIELIEQAICATNLKEFAESSTLITQEDFDQLQKSWCHTLIHFFCDINNCSYGRAAKIVAIYLKTSVVLPEKCTSQRYSFIHPPIDNRVLTSLSKKEGLEKLKKETWTKFDEEKYWYIVQKVRSVCNFFHWGIESGWTPSEAEGEEVFE